MEISLSMSVDEAESLEAFIRGHEREDVPDDVWEVCGRLMDELEADG